MDLLRSCYTTYMRFWNDNDLSIPVRWFWCDPTAKVFPEHHLFGSGNWASDRLDWPGPGELLGAPRPYSLGENIGPLVGDHFCGPVLGYREGTVFPGTPLDADREGISLCCLNLHLACGPHLDMPRMLRGIVTAADPLNTIFVLGFEFFLTWNVPFAAWRVVLPVTDPLLLPWMRIACHPAGPSNLWALFGSAVSGTQSASETVTPFSLTFSGPGPGLLALQYATSHLPLGVGTFDFFDCVVTR